MNASLPSHRQRGDGLRHSQGVKRKPDESLSLPDSEKPDTEAPAQSILTASQTPSSGSATASAAEPVKAAKKGKSALFDGVPVCMVIVLLFRCCSCSDFQGELMAKLWKKHFARSAKTTPAREFQWHAPNPAAFAVPDVSAYYRMTLTIWAPDITFAHAVPFMPCGVKEDCAAKADPYSHSPSARKVQGLERTELLLQARYSCPDCKRSFSAASDIAMAKLPPHVREAFPYVLSEAIAVTKGCDSARACICAHIVYAGCLT